MMKRIKTKDLFNKNHIIISKTERDNVGFSSLENYCSLKVIDSYYSNNRNDNYSFRKKKESIEVIKCESPLGFYYYKKVYHSTNERSTYITVSTVEVSMLIGKYLYRLVYPTSFGENKVSVDTRPWEIYANEKSMDSRFINILFSEVNKLLDLLYDNKIKEIKYFDRDFTTNTKIMSVEEFKKKLYKDLFGDEKGIRFQTNDEKILSHGFDLKESFRKPKEK